MADTAPKSRECLVFVRVGDYSDPSPLAKGEVSEVSGSRNTCKTCPSILGGFSCSGVIMPVINIDSVGSPRTGSLVDDEGNIVAVDVPVCKHVGERIVALLSISS
jgi:hypothetical protein